ncbi:hypothetical protein D3C87_1575870 [compost metagenome]
MSVKTVMDRLVANRGRYVDEQGRDLKIAQWFAIHNCQEGQKLVLIDNTETGKMRELTLMPDGQVVAHPKVIGRLEVRRGKMQYAIHVYNESGQGKLSDVFAL